MTTRRGEAVALAVLPANVKMAVDWRHRRPTKRAIAYGRPSR
ncbi:hypothetical protein [Micromonospora sp. NPDC048839]